MHQILFKTFITIFIFIFAHDVAAESFEGIKNLASVETGIYRGGRPEGEGFETLKKLGIKTVIDLQGGDINDPDFGFIAGLLQIGETAEWIQFEKITIQGMGMKFVNAPLASLNPLDYEEGYRLGQIITLLKDKKNHPIFIHCEHGIDRTGLMVALHRVFNQNWTRQRAHDEMIEMGHGPLRQLITGDMDSFFWAATEGQL